MVEPSGGSHKGHRRDDIRTGHANQADEVTENLLASPSLEGLLDAEGVSEVHGSREILFGAVHTMHGGELLGSEHTQLVEQFRADLVLAAVTARGRGEHRSNPLATPEHHQQGVVLIVGVRRGLHEDAHGVETAKQKAEADVAAIVGRRGRSGDEGSGDEGGDGQQEAQRRHSEPHMTSHKRPCDATRREHVSLVTRKYITAYWALNRDVHRPCPGGMDGVRPARVRATP